MGFVGDDSIRKNSTLDLSDIQTQTINTQSLSSSPPPPPPSGNKLKDGNGYEYKQCQSTVPLDDTAVLESPLVGTLLENLDGNTEVMDYPDCVENMRTLSKDENVKEVVPDSDDEGTHRTEVESVAKGLSYDESETVKRVVGDAMDLENRQLNSPCEQDKDFAADSDPSASVGYLRGVFSSVRSHSLQASGLAECGMTNNGNDSGPNNIQAYTRSWKQHDIKDDGMSTIRDPYLVDTNAKKVDTREVKRGATSNFESTDGRKDLTPLLARNHEFARLSYIGSQEPGESSQANALDFVDRFLSFNNVNLSQEVDPRNSIRRKSPPVSSVKGPQRLAKRINLRSPIGETGTFEWVDSHEDGGGDFFHKRKDVFFDCGGQGQISISRTQNARHLHFKRGSRLGDECEEKEECLNLHEEIMDSSFMVHNSEEIAKIVKESEMTSENIFSKELDEQFNAESSGQQLEDTGIGTDTLTMFDVGLGTQMAAEAMEALFYGPPAECNADYAYQDPQNTLEGSPRGVTKNKACWKHPSFQKRVCSDTGGVTRQSKRRKRPAEKISRQTSSSSRKHSKKQEELDPELAIIKEVKRDKPLAEKLLNWRNPTAANESSGQRSSKFIKQRKVEGAVDRDNFKGPEKYLSSSKSVQHVSLVKGQSQAECRNFSPTAHRTRQWTLVSSSKRIEDPRNNSGERTNDVKEFDVLKNRRKRSCLGADAFEVLSCRGNCSKLRSNTSGGARNNKLSQKEQTGLEANYLKLDVWSYPKGKRTRRNAPGHSNGASNPYAPFTLADGEKGNEHSLESQKRSKGNVGPTCFNLDVRRKTRSLVHTFPSGSGSYSKKNSEGSLLRGNFDEPASADVFNCDSTVMDKRKFPVDAVGAIVFMQSGKLDDEDSASSADGAERNVKLQVLSNEKVKPSGSECITPVYCTTGINGALPVFMGDKSYKHPCKKNVSRSPLVKELIRLGVGESIPNFTSKDFRKRRDMAKVRVLFSNHLDDNIIKHQKKVLARLGISIASCSLDATHFITDKFVRTRNMLEAIALGKPVVTHLWLESCGQASCFIDEKNYILRDAKKEKEIGFSMPVSLARATQHPLLQGQRVFITPNVKPVKELIASLVKAVHGQVVERSWTSSMKDEKFPDDLLILSCEEDNAICGPFLQKGAAVYSSELLLNGIVIQKLEYERHQLFTNHVKRNCSTV